MALKSTLFIIYLALLSKVPLLISLIFIMTSALAEDEVMIEESYRAALKDANEWPVVSAEMRSDESHLLGEEYDRLESRATIISYLAVQRKLGGEDAPYRALYPSTGPTWQYRFPGSHHESIEARPTSNMRHVKLGQDATISMAVVEVRFMGPSAWRDLFDYTHEKRLFVSPELDHSRMYDASYKRIAYAIGLIKELRKPIITSNTSWKTLDYKAVVILKPENSTIGDAFFTARIEDVDSGRSFYVSKTDLLMRGNCARALQILPPK